VTVTSLVSFEEKLFGTPLNFSEAVVSFLSFLGSFFTLQHPPSFSSLCSTFAEMLSSIFFVSFVLQISVSFLFSALDDNFVSVLDVAISPVLASKFSTTSGLASTICVLFVLDFFFLQLLLQHL